MVRPIFFSEPERNCMEITGVCWFSLFYSNSLGSFKYWRAIQMRYQGHEMTVVKWNGCLK